MAAKECVIVGNGLSIFTGEYGLFIDAAERVVRVKQNWLLTHKSPKHAGTRLDIQCSTLKTWGMYWKLPIKEYWGYQNFPGQDAKIAHIRDHFGSIPVRLESEAIQHWLGIYRKTAKIKGGYQLPGDGFAKEGDEPWFSSGMAAIVMACSALNPEQIVLFGFDNLLSGRRDDFKTFHRPAGHIYPPHAWNVECKMLPLIEKYYSARIYDGTSDSRHADSGHSETAGNSVAAAG